MSAPLRAFAALSPADRGRALALAVAVPLTHAALLSVGYERLRRLAHHVPCGWNRTPADPVRFARHRASLVDGVARGLLRQPACLSRSLVLLAWLRRHGVLGEIWFGVAAGPGGIDAHAWVTVGGTVVNDAADVAERFAPFARPIEGAL